MATQDELDELYARNLATMRPGSEVAPVQYSTSGPVQNMPSAISGESPGAQGAEQALVAKLKPGGGAGVSMQIEPVELGPENLTEEVAGEVPGEVVSAPGGAGNPYMDKAVSAMEAGAQKERAGIEAKAAVEAMKSSEKAKAMSKADLEATTYALKQKTIEEELAKMEREFEQRNIADEEEVRRAYQQRVDPSRYWANKDAGQKAMSVIAAGLFGYLGKGMEYLKRLDNLVAEDIRLQERERANKISMAEKIQDKHGQNYKTLRAAREQAYENSLRAENKMWMGLKHTLEAIDVAHAGQAAVAQKFVAMAHVDQQQAKVALDLAQLRSKELTERSQAMERAFARQQDLELKREAMELKKQKVAEGERLTPIMQTSIDHKVKYLQTLKNMRAKISTAGEGGGVVGTLKQGWNAASSLAGDTKIARELYNGLRHEATKARAESALQQHEIAYFQGDFPDYETFLSSGPKQLDEIIAFETNNLREYVDLQQSRGYNAKTEAFQKFLGAAPAAQPFKSQKAK